MSREPEGDDVRRGTARGDEPADPVGPTSRWGKPITIGGGILVVLAIIWAIVASGWFL